LKLIIIEKSLYPSAVYVSSTAINPISSYLMIKYFNANTFDNDENLLDIKFNNYEEYNNYFKEESNIISKTKLNESNIENAKKRV
jgi:hypothetical protein